MVGTCPNHELALMWRGGASSADHPAACAASYEFYARHRPLPSSLRQSHPSATHEVDITAGTDPDHVTGRQTVLSGRHFASLSLRSRS
jgi:hypothetical protein